MGASVLLHHRLPDGSSHYDWMIQPRPEAPLITFRVWERIDRPEVTEFRAERIGEHRAEYLTFEGEVSGGQGCVERVATGEFELVADDSANVRVQGRWCGSEFRTWLGREHSGMWVFRPAVGEAPP